MVRAMSIFGAEVIGTALLILLGNGVVACVLLNLSKGQNCWLDRHHVRLGHGGDGRRLRGRAVQRRASESGGDVRVRDRRQHRVERRARVLRRRVRRRVHRRDARVAGVPGPLARDGGPGPEARLLQHRRRRSATRSSNLITEVIGTFVLVFGVLAFFADKVDGRDRARRAARRPPGARHRALARRAHGLRDQPGARPRAADHARDPADRRARAARTGATPGSRSSARSSAPRSLRAPSSCSTRADRGTDRSDGRRP